jgi:single-stranded-DNA-specific exonuclease
LRLIAAGDDGRRIKAIAFRMAESALGEAMLAAPAHRRLWLAGRMKRDEYGGRTSAELHLEDAAWAD